MISDSIRARNQTEHQPLKKRLSFLSLVSVEEWRSDPEPHVAQTVATRRAERDARYQQALLLLERGYSSKEIACQLGVNVRTSRRWFERGVASDTKPRRKQQSDFDPYASHVLKRWQDSERNGARLWEEIAAQGYPGSHRRPGDQDNAH